MYPRLVRMARTPVTVVLEAEKPNEFGEREEILHANLMCNFQQKAHVIYTAQKEKISADAVLLFDGDICPRIALPMSGYVVIFGEKRRIVKGEKCRNADGSVNFTRLDVI